jgi:hypothetical protein
MPNEKEKADLKTGSTSNNLLCCPFCGSQASIKKGDFGERFVTCDNDGCGGRLGTSCWQTDDAMAARAWNYRAT